ncbi:MAG TPA: FAD-dependent oxidoreductase [Xanthobacteraceae bacterium]|jgi:succinate dehydrogenase/fumarate reductase flavoprotein subunit
MSKSGTGADKNHGTPSIDRRGFLTTGAAAGAATLAAAPSARGADAISWDREVDVLVIGAGAGGLVAAIAAREKGASVLIVEKNFDIGGRAMMSFGGLYIGGGNRIQKAIGMQDSPDLVFEDWSRPEKPMGRFSDRELVRTYADNNLSLFEWLEKHGIKWEGYRKEADRLDRHRTRLNVVPWPNEITNPGRGSGFVRPLAQTARQMGIEILLQQQMTKIHREEPLSGRVIGITAVEVDNRYQPLSRTMNVRARKGIIVATGGSAGNPTFRTMFDVRLTPEYQAENSEWTQRTADGEIAAMEIGAALGATACQTTQDDNLLTKGRMGKKSNGTATDLYATSPHFFRAGALGLKVKDYQNLILVKENGLRFYDETANTRDYEYYAAALAWTGDPKKLNGGGPVWAIFDSGAVAREKWKVEPPYVDPNGYFFSADTVEELARRIVNEYQWRPMPPERLRQTVERYNAFVDSGVDADFKKPTPMHKIGAPPFYAAWHTPALHDSYTGIRINTTGEVLDLRGKVISGLYACGDSAGGFGQHGICRAATFGRLAGWHAATQAA